jgi:translation initiation factor 2B subunit (eIF-2B alpha/beta/delta family)
MFAHFRKSDTRAKVLLGARGMFNGDDVLARMGSAMIASAARDCKIPVLVLAETGKKLPKSSIDAEIALLSD